MQRDSYRSAWSTFHMPDPWCPCTGTPELPWYCAKPNGSWNYQEKNGQVWKMHVNLLQMPRYCLWIAEAVTMARVPQRASERNSAKIPDEPVESMPVCNIKTDTTKPPGREGGVKSEDAWGQCLAKLQEQLRADHQQVQVLPQVPFQTLKKRNEASERGKANRQRWKSKGKSVSKWN